MEFANQSLLYWRRHHQKYKLLSVFATKYLGICFSSVASERLFSQSKGFISNRLSSRLETSTTEKFVLMNTGINENEGNNIIILE